MADEPVPLVFAGQRFIDRDQLVVPVRVVKYKSPGILDSVLVVFLYILVFLCTAIYLLYAAIRTGIDRLQAR